MSTIKREFAKYAALNILGQLAYACYTVADTFLVAARVGAEQLQIALSRFRTELADVRIDSEMGQLNMDGFLRFADWFFDGLLVDWTVLSRIHDSQASVSRVKEQVSDALSRLDELRRVREDKQGELEERMDHVVAGA